MVRTYKRKLGARPYADYTEDVLEECLSAIGVGMGVSTASATYNIPRRTLYKKIKERDALRNASDHSIENDSPVPPRKHGGQTIFSNKEENSLLNHILTLSEFGFPISKLDLRMVVKKYLLKTGNMILQDLNETPQPAKKRGRKKRNPINDPISEEDSDDLDNPRDLNETQPAKKRGRKKRNPMPENNSPTNLVDNEDVNVVNGERDDLGNVEHDDLANKNNTEVAGPSNSRSNRGACTPEAAKDLKKKIKELKAGTFVVCQYAYEVGKVTRYSLYVGKIITVFINKFYVQFLRQYKSRTSEFNFPSNDDYDYIKAEQIRTVLDTPEYHRGVYKFSIECV